MQEEPYHNDGNGEAFDEATAAPFSPLQTETRDELANQQDDEPPEDSDYEVTFPEPQLSDVLSEEQMASWRNTQALAYQLFLQSAQSAYQNDDGGPPLGIDPSTFDTISSQIFQNLIASLNLTPQRPAQLPLEPKIVRDIRVLLTLADNVIPALKTFAIEFVLWELLGPNWQTRYALDFYIYAIISYAENDVYCAIAGIVLFPLLTSLGGWNLVHFLLALLQPTSITYPDSSKFPLATLIKEHTLDLETEYWLKYLTASPFILVSLFLRAVYEAIRWVFPSIWLRVPTVLALAAGFWYHRMYNCQSTMTQTVSHWPRPIIRHIRRLMVSVLDLEATLRVWTLCLICQFKTWGLEQYTYTPLDVSKAEFRLLRLEPISDDPKDKHVVHCWLMNVPLSDHCDKNTYEAVSYRWGTERRNFPIVMNGKRFLVSRTVFDLLRALQQRDRDRYIWIDAICINQDHEHASSISAASSHGDLGEKTNQVSLMGSIYRGATRVIAWVGGTANGRGALSFIKKVVSQDSEAMENFEYQRTMQELWPWTILTTWFRVIELFQQSYFCRMWMLQEVSLNKDVILKHGNEEIDWDDIFGLVNFLMGSEGEPFLHEPGFWQVWKNDPATIFGVKGAHIMSLIRRQVNGWTADGNTWPQSVVQEWEEGRVRRLPLEFLLGLTTDLSATNVKDKVYAVLGLTQHETRRHIKIEYDDTIMSPEDLLRDVAKHVLVSRQETAERFYLAGWGYEQFGIEVVWGGSIWSRIASRIRSILGRPAPAILNLPSWVPQWTMDRLQMPAVESVGFSAGLHGTRLFEEIPDRPDCMRTALSFVDEIEMLGKPFISAKEMLQYPTNFFLMIRDFVLEAKGFADQVYKDALAREEPVSREKLEEEMYRTIFGDYATGALPPMDRSVLLQLMSVCEAVIESKGFPKQTDEKAYEKLGFELGRAIGGRRFCGTKAGRFGIVPTLSRVGDSIVIIWGTATPFVMRSGTQHRSLLSIEPNQQRPMVGSWEGDEHVLIGSCYMNGVMLGEIRPADHPPEMVVLR
ncbi:heterokaryon incompatibility protein-domain-containing protein [Apiosordaria backusii]|uniref:Heterokaryon incompatibility protein-domain-containing protein n=1 Tax=Apiosordaria backusii TaxID=314023 RepID=A0AA40AMT0_9PEZI|nr:heterokaryon incompatibility protein-domain-containing protein [Apiosordaria backusii]